MLHGVGQHLRSLPRRTATTPDVAVERQIERYREMTGEERLRIALDLHAFSCEVAREGIRHQFPQADAATVERRLQQRMEAARR